MKLLPKLRENKSMLLGLIILGRAAAKLLGIDPNAPISVACAAVGVNRTHAYGQADRITGAVEDLAARRPGRPRDPDAASVPGCRARGAGRPAADDAPALRIRVLEYRLDHPGSCVPHSRKTTYSPGFRRFILDELDRWAGTFQAFAEAAGVPLDTLRDWIDEDARGLRPDRTHTVYPETKRDASATARAVYEAWEQWEGSVRSFVRIQARELGLRSNQVYRLLQVAGLIRTRSRRRPFRYRDSTERLAPGNMLVTDGKMIPIHLTHSNTYDTRNWQGTVDQTTGCHTAVVVTPTESASSVREAYDASVAFLGGLPPVGILVDNRSPNTTPEVVQHIEGRGTMVVEATPGRGENKAILEGEFGRWEQRVGMLRLDDYDTDTLITSAVREVVRAYTKTLNQSPRAELDGQSPLETLRQHRPSWQERAKDAHFLRTLRSAHQNARRPAWHRRRTPITRGLLDKIFASLGLAELDPLGHLRDYLSSFSTTAIRRAAALVSAKLVYGAIDPSHAHRYLAKVIRSIEDELHLEHASHELLRLAEIERQDWTSLESAEAEVLRRTLPPDQLAKAFAERAAWGGLPLQGAFWTERLLELLDDRPHLTETVRRHLVRLYEAPFDNRLALIDRILTPDLAP